MFFPRIKDNKKKQHTILPLSNIVCVRVYVCVLRDFKKICTSNSGCTQAEKEESVCTHFCVYMCVRTCVHAINELKKHQLPVPYLYTLSGQLVKCLQRICN